MTQQYQSKKKGALRLQVLARQVCAAAPGTTTDTKPAVPAPSPDAVFERRAIPILDATPENFSPFGTILGENPVDPATNAAQGGARYASLRASNPTPNFMSDQDTTMIVLSYEPRGFECEFMERHYKHTQVFIPLEGKPLVGFFAPPNEKEEPDLEKIVALRFDGSAGFIMHKGTWHEQPFPVLPSTKAVCILRKETVRELRPAAGTRECHGQDIDKVDLKARHNLVFTTNP